MGWSGAAHKARSGSRWGLFGHRPCAVRRAMAPNAAPPDNNGPQRPDFGARFEARCPHRFERRSEARLGARFLAGFGPIKARHRKALPQAGPQPPSGLSSNRDQSLMMSSESSCSTDCWGAGISHVKSQIEPPIKASKTIAITTSQTLFIPDQPFFVLTVVYRQYGDLLSSTAP